MEGDPRVEAMMRPLYGAEIPTADYNRIYSLVADGLRWRDKAKKSAPAGSGQGPEALALVARFADFEKGRCRYNVAASGSYWEGYDAAMAAVVKFCREHGATPALSLGAAADLAERVGALEATWDEAARIRDHIETRGEHERGRQSGYAQALRSVAAEVRALLEPPIPQAEIDRRIIARAAHLLASPASPPVPGAEAPVPCTCRLPVNLTPPIRFAMPDPKCPRHAAALPETDGARTERSE